MNLIISISISQEVEGIKKGPSQVLYTGSRRNIEKRLDQYILWPLYDNGAYLTSKNYMRCTPPKNMKRQ